MVLAFICALLTVQGLFTFFFPLCQLFFVGLNQLLTFFHYTFQCVVGFVAYLIVRLGNGFDALHGFSDVVQIYPAFFFLFSIIINCF